jgi:gamma-glutamyl:cysteine ligase YbdK (ATP-grasp superfamily)|tara:strand:- start:1436 stop:2620 length:1185 start_codon:yes stop_codon:yes gene_type:complete
MGSIVIKLDEWGIKMVKKIQSGYSIEGDGLVHPEYIVEGNYEGILFGPELEFFVVDKDTHKPKDCLDELAGLPGFDKEIKPELAAEQIEITTSPSYSISELEDRLTGITRNVVASLERVNAELLPVALFDGGEFTITPEPRYQLLIENLGNDFRQNAVKVASDQINIGAENEEQAFRIFNALTEFLPEFMAYSVSSPFLNGTSNGIASNRLDAYDRAITKYLHFTGLPSKIENLEEYASELGDLPIFQHPNMFYKYSRPMPQRGVAAEIRCMDKQPTIQDYLAFVVLSKAFVLYVEQSKDTQISSLLSGPSSESDVETAFAYARRYGIKDYRRSRTILNFLSTFLDQDEVNYLGPLYGRLAEGDLSKQMMRMSQNIGVEGVYRNLSANLVASLK